MLKEVIFLFEKVCFINFGMEVVMIMICVVCVYIGRDKIIKFVGCYYGYFDLVFVEVGFGFFMFGILDFVGVMKLIVEEVIIVLFNDFVFFKEVLVVWGD